MTASGAFLSFKRAMIGGARPEKHLALFLDAGSALEMLDKICVRASFLKEKTGKELRSLGEQ